MNAELERLARTMGVTYTPDTTEDELRDLVDQKMSQETAEEGSAAKMPACYGRYWEDIPGTKECQECNVAKACLHRFSTSFLPTIQKEAKGDFQKLQEMASIKPEALLLAINYAKGLDEKPPVEMRPVTPPQDIEKAEPQKETKIEAKESESEPKEEQMEVSVPEKKKPPTKKKKAPTKKKTTKKKATKKTARKAVENPPKAESVKRAKDSAPKKVGRKKKSAKTAKGRARVKKTFKQGTKERTPTQMYEKWLRERKKHPEIGILTPGKIAKREWPRNSGNFVEVKCLKGRYVFQSQEYATLQEVTNAIVGLKTYQGQRRQSGVESARREKTRKMTNWSAKRFWAAVLDPRRIH